MEHSWLDSFVGHHVTVVTGSVEERSDTGTLLRIGDGWLHIVKDNGEMILVPGSAIRIVKLLDMTQTVGAVNRPDLAPAAPQTASPLLNDPDAARFPDGF